MSELHHPDVMDALIEILARDAHNRLRYLRAPVTLLMMQQGRKSSYGAYWARCLLITAAVNQTKYTRQQLAEDLKISYSAVCHSMYAVDKAGRGGTFSGFHAKHMSRDTCIWQYYFILIDRLKQDYPHLART